MTVKKFLLSIILSRCKSKMRDIHHNLFQGLACYIEIPLFPNVNQSEYKSSVRFSFESLSKIENLYVSRVEKNKKFGQICKKLNFVE